jgi:DinB superfamily
MHFPHAKDEAIERTAGGRAGDDETMNLKTVYDTLSRTPAAFRALLSQATDEALAYREAAEAWNAHEVLCHVTDGEVTDWRPRVAIIMADGDKRFAPFDRLGGHRTYGRWVTAALLDEFDRLRRDNLAYLARLNLDAVALSRTGLHPEFGAVTLEQLLSCWMVHDLAHIAQISRSLVRYFGPDVGPWKKYFSLLHA